MTTLAEQDMTTSLDKIIYELDRAVALKITLTPALVGQLRDLLVTVRDCGRLLSEAEREILERESSVRVLSLVPDEFSRKV